MLTYSFSVAGWRPHQRGRKAALRTGIGLSLAVTPPAAEDLRALSIVNATATATLAKFLPELVYSDAETKLKPIIWHGSVYRFQRSQCERSSNESDLEIGMGAAAYLAGILDGCKDGPWDVYHDIRGTSPSLPNDDLY